MRITFVTADGDARVVDAEAGGSVMRAAVQNAVPGILAECGGACSCATCYVYVDPAWSTAAGAPGPLESEMLALVPDRRNNSRLSCQIELSAGLDGLVVRIPAQQGY